MKLESTDACSETPILRSAVILNRNEAVERASVAFTVAATPSSQHVSAAPPPQGNGGSNSACHQPRDEASRIHVATRRRSHAAAAPGLAKPLAANFTRAEADYCREPRADELKVLADGLAKRTARFQQSAEEAAKILTVGETKADAKFNPVELAAYTGTANVLLNLDEVVTRE